MSDNLGQTSLRRRKRPADPMRAFDALPSPLRGWLANAALPWSPASVRKVWTRARARGLSESEVLDFLNQCEAGSLRRDSVSTRAAARTGSLADKEVNV